jgi:hypothetical protein
MMNNPDELGALEWYGMIVLFATLVVYMIWHEVFM